ncbi:MAG: hypothetical protein AB1758_17935 [Candidatus Eremiobacterota bacterium]
MSGTIPGFPNLQWGFGAPTTPAGPPAPQAAVPEIDYSDGINNALEMALLPGLDLVPQEAVAGSMAPGVVAHFRASITRSDRPGWAQEFRGSAAFNPDGLSGHSNLQLGTPGQPPSATIQDRLYGTQTQGRIEPGRVPGVNEQVYVNPGWNGGATIQASIDGQPATENSFQSHDPNRGQVTVHQGNLNGTPLQRTLWDGPQGREFEGSIGTLRETGRVFQGPNGTLCVIRDIGPYHVEQEYSFQHQGGQGFGGPMGMFGF